MSKFFKKSFDFEFDLKKPGRIRIKTKIKNKAGTISSKPTINYSKNF